MPLLKNTKNKYKDLRPEEGDGNGNFQQKKKS